MIDLYGLIMVAGFVLVAAYFLWRLPKDIGHGEPDAASDTIDEDRVAYAASRLGQVPAPGWLSGKVDAAYISKLLPQVARFPMPLLDYTNARGNRRTVGKRPSKPVTPVQTRQVPVSRWVWEDVAVLPELSGQTEVSYQTDDVDLQLVRGVHDIAKIPLHHLELPDDLLFHKLTHRELPRRAYYEPKPEQPQVVRQLVERTIMEAVPDTTAEETEVHEDRGSHLLVVLLDVSPSMFCEEDTYRHSQHNGIHPALALMMLLLSQRRDDGSRYIVRQFARTVGKPEQATTPAEKEELFDRLSRLSENHGLGQGTNVIDALRAAGSDVKRFAKRQPDARLEVLLITDSEATQLSSEIVRAALPRKVTLHTVVANTSTDAPTLRRRSATFFRYRYDKRHILWGTSKRNWKR